MDNPYKKRAIRSIVDMMSIFKVTNQDIVDEFNRLKKKKKKDIIIEVKGGCVTDVLNVMKGYDYIINDLDVKED